MAKTKITAQDMARRFRIRDAAREELKVEELRKRQKSRDKNREFRR